MPFFPILNHHRHFIPLRTAVRGAHIEQEADHIHAIYWLQLSKLSLRNRADFNECSELNCVCQHFHVETQ